MGENKPQEVVFGKVPPSNEPTVVYGKVPESDGTTTTAESEPETAHNPGVVADYSGGDPVPDDAVSDAADDGSAASDDDK